jgi:hypothetical protein
MNNVLTLLFAQNSHAIICKKATLCLGALAVTLPDSLLNRLGTHSLTHSLTHLRTNYYLVEAILENIDLRSGDAGQAPRGGISSPVGLLIQAIGMKLPLTHLLTHSLTHSLTHACRYYRWYCWISFRQAFRSINSTFYSFLW